MTQTLQRLAVGWAWTLQATFFTVLLFVIGIEPRFDAYSKGYAIAGLLLFYPCVLLVAPIRIGNQERLLAGMAFASLGGSIFYAFSAGLHHPMMRYSFVREADESIDRIRTDESREKASEVATTTVRGESVYSPRIGMLFGRQLSWDGRGSLPIWRVELGFESWFFGVAVVCEFFAFFVMHVSIFLAPAVFYAYVKESPQEASGSVNLKRSAFMLLFFLIGLLPVCFGAW